MLNTELQSTELKAIIASLYYLETEAKKAGFEEISLMFRKTISDVDKWISDRILDNSLQYRDVVDSDLYRILCLLEKFSIANRFDLKSIFDAIEGYDAIRNRAN